MITITPDPMPRDSQYHKKIVKTEPIPGTKSGHKVELECGHTVMTFGKLEYAEGIILCDFCRGIVK